VFHPWLKNSSFVSSIPESPPASAGQILRLTGDELLAVIGALLAPLLLLDDPPASFPVGSRHDGIDGACAGMAHTSRD